MALSFTGSGNVGISGVTISGLESPQEVTIEEFPGGVVKAKDGKGVVNALLLTKGQKTMQVSGYGSANAAVNLLTSATGPNFSGKVIESSHEATGEDFSKISITALAI